MKSEDALLYLADPDYAMTLGIKAPKCARCGGGIKAPPADWDGERELVHAVPVACVWGGPKEAVSG